MKRFSASRASGHDSNPSRGGAHEASDPKASRSRRALALRGGGDAIVVESPLRGVSRS